MDKGIDQKLNEFLSAVIKNYKELEAAFLFGSYAKGTHSENSDIDLALVFTHLPCEKFDLQVELLLLAFNFDSRIEPYPISKKEFNSNHPLSLSIKNGVELPLNRAIEA